MLQGLNELYNNIRHASRFWGIWNGMRIALFPLLHEKMFGVSNPRNQNKVIMELLRKEWAPIVECYRKMEHNEAQPITTDSPIWVCWWQGEAEMPEMTHKCYELLQANSNGHPVHLITRDNYSEYINLPQHIIECVENKSITFIFLSDLLRTSLIAKYGGIWVDSTYWLTRPLDVNGQKLFTYRQDRFKGQGGINDFNWTCHLIGTGTPYYIFDFLRECLLLHVEKHHKIVTYLLIDFAINLAYESFEDFRLLIDRLPDHKPHIYIMPWLFNQKLDEENLKEILNTTPLLKLSYKLGQTNYIHTTPEGERTYYDWFISQEVKK